MHEARELGTRMRVDVSDGTARTTVDARGPELEAALLERLADNQLRMPPYPAIAMKLKALAQSGRASTGEIAAVIQADAALVAAVLRRANATAYGGANPIIALDLAIGRLGVEQIVEVAIAQSVGAAMSTSGPLQLLRRDVWRRSLLAANIAAELAPARGVDRDAAFVAGLVHDFGAIIVLVGLEDLDTTLPVQPATAWRRFVDRLRVPFGRVFAARWRLPDPIAESIEYWTKPHEYAGTHRALVDLIANVTTIIARLDDAPADGVASVQSIEGLSAHELQRVQQLVPRIAEVMASFEPATTGAGEPSAVEAPAPPDEHWPLDLVVTTKAEALRACAVDPNTLVLLAQKPMALNWLVQLVLHCEPRLDMLANVITCDEEADGTYRILARPFALGGEEKATWLGVVQSARRAATKPAEPPPAVVEQAPAPEPAPTAPPAEDRAEPPRPLPTSPRLAPRAPVVVAGATVMPRRAPKLALIGTVIVVVLAALGVYFGSGLAG